MDETSKPKVQLRRGHVVDMPQYGLVKFERLDFYHGECTVKLISIQYSGTYYPKIETIMDFGFEIIDN